MASRSGTLGSLLFWITIFQVFKSCEGYCYEYCLLSSWWIWFGMAWIIIIIVAISAGLYRRYRIRRMQIQQRGGPQMVTTVVSSQQTNYQRTMVHPPPYVQPMGPTSNSAPTYYSQYDKPPPPFSPPPAYNSVEPPPPSYNTSTAYPTTDVRY